MRIRRGRSISALAVAAGLAATAACGSSNGGGTPNANPTGGGASTPATVAKNLPKGGTLKVISQADVGNLDTNQAYEVVAWTLFRAINRQLVTYPGSPKGLAEDAGTVDDLAASHTVSPDGLTYTFKLRPGLKYSGPSTRAIDSKDFEYAIKRLCDPNGASGAIGYYTATIAGLDTFCTGFAKVKTGDPVAVKTYIDGNDVSGITEPDAQTVVFTLKQKAGDFLNILALPFATPQPEEVLSPYLTDSPQMRQHFVSSGPYTLTTYVPDKSYTFMRTPGYDSSQDPVRAAYADQISVDLTAGSDATEFEQIQAGTSDASLDVTAPPAPVVAMLRSTNDPTLHITPQGRVDYASFNLRASHTQGECAAAIKKVEVRQAFNYAVNKQSIVQVLGGESQAAPTGQILTSTITGYKKADPYGTPNDAGDPAKAKQMLAAAGYPNGLTCTGLYRTPSKGTEKATALQQDLKKAGITLNLNQTPPKDYYGKHLQLVGLNDWDIQLVGGWSPDWQGKGARSFYVPLLDGKASPCVDGTANYGCYDNPAVDSLVDQALQSENPADLWAQADATTMKDAPWVPLVERKAIAIVSKRVKGFQWFNFANNLDIANASVA